MNEREQFQLEIESVKTLANRIRTELGLEVSVDDVDTYIGGEKIFLLLLLRKFEIKQIQNHVEKILEAAGYKCRDAEPKVSMSVWTKQSGQSLVSLFPSAIEFRMRASKATTLTELFKNRPDYILIAQAISKVHNSAVAREVFLSLSYDERFVNKTYGKDR